jgi:hypothetical protein
LRYFCFFSRLLRVTLTNILCHSFAGVVSYRFMIECADVVVTVPFTHHQTLVRLLQIQVFCTVNLLTFYTVCIVLFLCLFCNVSVRLLCLCGKLAVTTCLICVFFLAVIVYFSCGLVWTAIAVDQPLFCFLLSSLLWWNKII